MVIIGTTGAGVGIDLGVGDMDGTDLGEITGVGVGIIILGYGILTTLVSIGTMDSMEDGDGTAGELAGTGLGIDGVITTVLETTDILETEIIFTEEMV